MSSRSSGVRPWDDLFARDDSGLLLKRMDEAVDGDFQKYTVAPGSYIRRHFFGKYPPNRCNWWII